MSKFNKYVSDFKEMPFLIKLYLIASLYFLVTALLDFVQMKPITFEYFNSGFPKNYPLIWYLYYLLFGIVNLIVLFKRSYSLLKKYLAVGVVISAILLLNSVYIVVNLPSEQRVVSIIAYTFFYFIFGGLIGLIFLYLLKQKKYFNKI